MSPRKPRVDEIAVILACRQQGCAWDYLGTGWYVTFNRYGYRRWERTANVCAAANPPNDKSKSPGSRPPAPERSNTPRPGMN